MKHNHIPFITFISIYTRFSPPLSQGTAEAIIKRENEHTANLFFQALCIVQVPIHR